MTAISYLLPSWKHLVGQKMKISTYISEYLKPEDKYQILFKVNDRVFDLENHV